MGFEELFWNRFDELNKDTNLAYTFGCDSYKAGAASRQAEIDKLKQALKTSLAAHKCVCLERDELQARIDLVVAKVNEYYDTDGMFDLVFFDVANILKGNKDEN